MVHNMLLSHEFMEKRIEVKHLNVLELWDLPRN